MNLTRALPASSFLHQFHRASRVTSPPITPPTDRGARIRPLRACTYVPWHSPCGKLSHVVIRSHVRCRDDATRHVVTAVGLAGRRANESGLARMGSLPESTKEN